MSDIQSSMRKTLALLETVESGQGSYLLEGQVKQIASDLEDLSDTEFLKHYKKTKAEVRKEFPDAKKQEVTEGMMKRMLEKRASEQSKAQFVSNADEHGMSAAEAEEFWIAVNGDDEELDEAADHLDPNLHKAYMMGVRAYQAYKDHPEQAQRAQDKIDAEFPQYSKMWLTGYRDAERFDREEAIKEETSSTYSIESKPCPVCKEKELTYNQGADHLSCGGCGTGFSRADNGKWRKENTSAKKSFADMMGGSAKDLTKGLSIKESEVDEGIGKKIAHGIGKAVKKVAPNWVEKQVKADDERQAKAKKAAVDKFTSIAQKDTKKVDEDRTVEKDKEGNVVRWKEEGEWKKASGKDPRGKVTNMSDKARRETDRIKSSKK